MLVRIGLHALAGCLFTAAASAVTGPTVIVHPAVESAPLSVNEARLYLTRKVTAWPDATPVVVFVLPDDAPLHDEFSRTVLGLFPYQLRQAWDRQIYSGTGQGPEVVTTESEMLRRVATTPGAIGYVGNVPPDAPVKPLEVQ